MTEPELKDGLVEKIAAHLKNRQAVYVEELSRNALREAGCWDCVAVLPANFNDRVQYFGDTLVQMLVKMEGDDSLRRAVGTLAQTLSYLMNSSSWQDGKLHDFDRDEVKRKLRSFT